MAINTIHPIKRTLHYAVDYICNPEKTDDRVYISSQNCVPETAVQEFALTRDEAIRPGKNLAWHWIQAFDPGEVDAATAHEIGMKIAREHLGENAEFIVSTHIDKGHIHNHILFNAVDQGTRKYYDADKITYYQICNRSDRLCKEYGLSVIKQRSKKGKSIKKVYAQKDVQPSKTEQLKTTIDKVISRSNDFDDFLSRMEQEGYTLTRESSLSFLKNTEEKTRAIRVNSEKFYNGEYTKENIIAMIEAKEQRQEKKHVVSSSPGQPGRLAVSFPNRYKIEAVQRAKIRNAARQELQRIVTAYNYLVDNNVKGLSEIESTLSKTYEELYEVRAALKKLDNRIADTRQLRDISSRFREVLPAVKGLEAATERQEYQKVHKKEFMVYASLRRQLQERGFQKVPNIEKINRLLQSVEQERTAVYSRYQSAKEKADLIKMVCGEVSKIMVKESEYVKDSHIKAKKPESL